MALIILLIQKHLQMRFTFGWSLSNLAGSPSRQTFTEGV